MSRRRAMYTPVPAGEVHRLFASARLRAWLGCCYECGLRRALRDHGAETTSGCAAKLLATEGSVESALARIADYDVGEGGFWDGVRFHLRHAAEDRASRGTR